MPRILIADDYMANRTCLKDLIETFDKGRHEILEAGNGHEAIAHICTHQSRMIHLVITDFEMGLGPDGVEVAREASRQGIQKIFLHTHHDVPVRGVQRNFGINARRLLEGMEIPNVQVVEKLIDMARAEKILRPCLEELKKAASV